jgi:uncharacterized damage-inducible protein DinB
VDEDLRYPIGRFEAPAAISAADRAAYIETVAATPALARAAVAGLDERRLDTRYREGGWTIRQVIHHLADDHLNSYLRSRLALTEDDCVIRPYDEPSWAELPDARTAPVACSLDLLEALHVRWVALFRDMTESDFARSFVHPRSGRSRTLAELLALYDWHGRHHVAQITRLRERMGW